MIATTTSKLSFEQYQRICELAEGRYELEQGELIEMTPPTWLHLAIAKFLERCFDREIERLGHPWEAFREPGQQTAASSSRLPDVAVVPRAALDQRLGEVAILTVAAVLLVEVVSESTAVRDYREKVAEYQAKGIEEYWIADPDPFGAAKYVGTPKRPTVSVYLLVDGVYQVRRFQGEERIVSATFPALNLTAEQVLGAGR
jgi:Uma2 family endonuclease